MEEAPAEDGAGREPDAYWDEEMLEALTGRRAEPMTTSLPPRVEAWRRRSATGALLTGVALGLQEVFEPRRDPVAIVAEAPGEPPGPPQPLEVHLDPDDPAASSVVVRRWLLDPPGDVTPTG